MRRQLLLLAFLVIWALAALLPDTITSQQPLSLQYRYKFPCNAGEDCAVTQTAHVNNALDFDIGGGAYSGTIRSMSQGTVFAKHVSQDVCTPSGLGKWYEVDDIFGRRVVYAHLASFAVSETQRVFQGDVLGVEGNTGNAGWPDCAVHLHWEPGGGLPEYIDAVPTGGLCAVCWYNSTNAQPGGRPDGTWHYGFWDEYRRQGHWYGVGWTHAYRGTEYIHDYRVWGQEQNFRHDPDGFGTEFEAIYAPAWDPTATYHIDSPLWAAWEAGALIPDRPDPVSISVPWKWQQACPAGSRSDCAAYQLTHLGYLWLSVFGQPFAVWCPDVHEYTPPGEPPPPGFKNGVVDISDVLADLYYVFTDQGGPPNGNGVYYHPWWDMDGNTSVDMADIIMVLGGTFRECKPT